MCGWRREKFASRSATARANQRRAAEALGVRLFFGEKLCGRTRVGRRLQADGSHAGGQDDEAIVALKNVPSLVSFYYSCRRYSLLAVCIRNEEVEYCIPIAGSK